MLLTSSTPASVLFWSGAGISVDGPTHGPLGQALTERALGNYMADGTSQVIKRLYASVNVANAALRPRLETVLDALVDAHGIEALGEVLSDLSAAKPNRHHAFFADHLVHGGRHVTANFDTCIERAPTGSQRTGDRLFHFHGSLGLNDPGELERLGARLQVIENGLGPQITASLDRLLTVPEVTTFVFVGYSGSDFFDATPYLLERADLLRARNVIWYEFANGPLEWCAAEGLREAGLLASLLATGVKVQGVKGRLSELLDGLRDAWTMPATFDVPTRLEVPWRPQQDRARQDREAATFALYASMGYRAGVIETATQKPPDTPRAWERLADAFWGAGRYNEARHAWEQAFAGDDAYNQARRVERQGAILWIQGKFLAAQRLLWSGIQRWAAQDSAAGPFAAAMLLETYGRVIEHMGRSPETRYLVRPSRRAFARNRLHDLLTQLQGQEGIALRARFENVLAFLDGVADPRMSDHITAFEESEALHAWMNYRQGRLRHLATETPTSVLVEDYDRQVRDQAAIGATADAARALLIPGACRYASPRALRRAFSYVEMSRWHRTRLTIGFTAAWLTEHLKHPKAAIHPASWKSPLDSTVAENFHR